MPNYQQVLYPILSIEAGSRSMPVGGFFSYRDYPSLHRPGPPLMFYMCVAIYSHQSSVVHSEQQIGQALKDTLPTVQRQSSLPQLQHLGVRASGSFPSIEPLIAGVLLRVSFHMSRRLVPSQCPLVHRRTSYSLRHSTRPPALGGTNLPRIAVWPVVLTHTHHPLNAPGEKLSPCWPANSSSAMSMTQSIAVIAVVGTVCSLCDRVAVAVIIIIPIIIVLGAVVGMLAGIFVLSYTVVGLPSAQSSGSLSEKNSSNA